MSTVGNSSRQGGNMEIQKFLDRIGFKGNTKVDLETLGRLQTCYHVSVPYENIDVVLGVPLVLTKENLYKKVVERRRGGWCHELNSFFSWALKEIGFEVDIVSASYKHDHGFARDFDHMPLIVHLEGTRYFVDVGSCLSLSPVLPVPLDGVAMKQPNGVFKVTDHGDHWHISSQRLDEPDKSHWTTSFRVRVDTPHLMEDFQEVCDIYQSGAEEIIRDLLYVHPIASIKDGDNFGSHLILRDKYRKYFPLGYTTREASNVEENMTEERFGELLNKHFGIKTDLSNLKWDEKYGENRKEFPKFDTIE